MSWVVDGYRIGPFLGLFLLLFGGYLCSCVVTNAENLYAMNTRGVHVAGQVTAVTPVSFNSPPNDRSQEVKKTNYRYTVSFTDRAGAKHEIDDTLATEKIEHRVGSTMPVVYLESDPQKTAVVDHGWMNWFSVVMQGIAAIVVLGMGLAAFVAVWGLASIRAEERESLKKQQQQQQQNMKKEP